MKKIIFTLYTLLLGSSIFAQDINRSIRPKPGPAPLVQMGTAQSFVSKNGIKVFVVENHKLPSVSYSIDLDIHPELQGEMVGYQDMIGELLTAGTKSKSKDQFNQELDMLGATLNISSEGIYMQSLTKNSDKLLALCAEVLTSPNFQQSELDKLKKQAKSGLAQQQDDPEAMSRNITAVLQYGKNHPYGEITTEKSIDKITLDRCKKYFETYFRPNVAYLAIVGDITMEQAKIQVDKYFSAWQKKEVPVAKYSTPKPPAGASVGIVNKSSAVQSVIDITYPMDLKPGSPDEVKLKVANGILGGGSTGRLFQNLRETHGWTYGSYSSVKSDELPFGGSFSATANSTTAATDSSVAEILKEMTKIRTELVPEEQLQGFKNYMAGTFALGLEDPRTLARYAINERKYNMPKDYYRNYLKNVEAVTAEDVRTVAQKYITPGVAYITVAGDKKTTAEKLKAFGPVTIYDLEGNVVKEQPVAAMPSNVSARSVIQKHIDATGGTDAWKKVTDLTQIMNMEVQGMKISVKTVRKAPNKLMMDVSMMGNSLQKIVFDGAKGYMAMQGQKKEFDEEETKKYAADANMSEELGYLAPECKLSVKGIEKVDNEDAYQVEVTKANGDVVMEYYNVKTGLKVKSEESAEGPKGVQTQTSYYLNYQDGKAGLKFPQVIKQSGGPMGMVELNMQSVEVNTGVSDEVFH